MNSTITPIKAALAALKDTEARLLDPGIALAPKADQVATGIRVDLLRRRNTQEAALVAALVAYSPKDHPELQISLDGAIHLVRFDRVLLEEQLDRISPGPVEPPKARGRDIPW